MKLTVTYPNYIAWRIDLHGLSSGMELFKGSSLKHLKKAFQLLEESKFRFVFETVDKLYIERFAPLHRNLMREKNSSFQVDFDRLITKISHAHYQALSFYNDKQYLGGMLYSIQKDLVKLIYRVLPHEISLPIPVSLAKIADVLLANVAIQKDIKYYSLGMGKNPFGISAAIGLAGYKMMNKARPFIPMTAVMSHEFNWDQSADILLFSGDQLGSYVNKAKLLLSDPNNITKYQFLNSQFLDLEIIPSADETKQW